MNLERAYRERLESHREVVERMAELEDAVTTAVNAVANTFRSGHRVLLAGNGGSAADVQHWAAEWVIRLDPRLKRPGLPAIALTTDSSILTAGANDLGYDHVFERQVEALGRDGDLLIAVSTSGNSRNLVLALDKARQQGMRGLGILGKDGGEMLEHCDLAVVVPSDDTQRIQEMHSFIGHLLCELSEQMLYGGE